MGSLFRSGRRRPLPQRGRSTSGRGAHSAGSNFVNAMATNVTVNGNDMTIVFDQPVALSALHVPQYVAEGAAVAPVSAAQSADDTIVVTFDGSVGAATGVVIPQNDAAVRTRSGGWADAGSFPVSI